MKCPRCDADNRRGAIACWQCYANLTDEGATAPMAPAVAVVAADSLGNEMPPVPAMSLGDRDVLAPAVAAMPSRPAKRAREPRAASATGRKLPIVPIVVALLVVGGGAGAFLVIKGRAGDPAAVVKEMLEADKKHDWEALKKTVTTSAQAKVDAQKQTYDRVASNPMAASMMPQLESYEIVATNVSGEEATITVKVSAKAFGKAVTGLEQRYVSIKEGGAWKVDVGRTEQENALKALQAMGLGNLGGMLGKMGRGR